MNWDTIYNTINSVEINTWSSIYKLLLSMILGAMVGYERKRKGQTAGVRTFSLIAMGATLAMILSVYVPQEYLGLKNGDPGRIAAQVVTGIGFLGAGAIIQMKGSVRGLTTAAGIWMVAAIGMCVGVGMYWLSLVATLLILFILVQLEKFEHKVSIGAQARILKIKTSTIVDDIKQYRLILTKHHITTNNYYVDYEYDRNITTLNIAIVMPDKTDVIPIFKKLRELNPTISIQLTTQVSL